MKDILFIRLSCASFILFSFSCSDNQEKIKQWTKVNADKLLDSIEITRLIAGYNEYDGYSLIIKDDSSKARKVTYRRNFPLFVDSLIQTGIHEFKSRRYSITYLVNDSEVVSTYLQKIIHPSSNWQGQTPWQETLIYTYPRLDRNLQ